jgi:hypothetical protein
MNLANLPYHNVKPEQTNKNHVIFRKLLGDLREFFDDMRTIQA